jgi:hypothetical protein
MKKLIFFIALFIGGGRLMAQNATPAPYDNTLNGKLVQPFKADSTWRTVPPVVSTDKFFKQPNLDISKIESDKRFEAMVNINKGYNMPIIVTEGNSKMPVVKPKGYSKMPVVNPDPKNFKEIKKANP